MRKMNIHLLLILLTFSIFGLEPPASAQAPCDLKAFPNAMGFGECASGGRDGVVYYVTSLADSGPHTLRWALGQYGRRTILFALPGIIELQSDLVIENGNVTVIGLPYSPTITGATVVVNASNVILRHLAIKVGSQNGEIGSCQPTDGCNDGKWCNEACIKDALILDEVSDIMLDHLSLYWSTDELLSAKGVERVTLSNSILAEPLHWALKHNENCKEGKSCPPIIKRSSKWKIGHGFCQRWAGSKKVSVVGSLFMNCFRRGFQANSDGRFDSKILLGNNVFYDYYHHGVTWNDNDHGNRDAQFVLYNNYFIGKNRVRENETLPFDPPGFENKESKPTVDIESPKDGSEVEMWMQGNYEESGDEDCELLDGADDDGDLDCRGLNNLPGFVDDADPIPFLPAYSSQSNLADYLQFVGRRQSSELDNYDRNVVQAVLYGGNRRMVNQEPVSTAGTSGGHFLGCVPHGSQAPATFDKDCDGMPDAWELSHGLNPGDPWDATADRDGDGYNNFEEWMFHNAI